MLFNSRIDVEAFKLRILGAIRNSTKERQRRKKRRTETKEKKDRDERKDRQRRKKKESYSTADPSLQIKWLYVCQRCMLN